MGPELRPATPLGPQDWGAQSLPGAGVSNKHTVVRAQRPSHSPGHSGGRCVHPDSGQGQTPPLVKRV